jgi:hypothetical protein
MSDIADIEIGVDAHLCVKVFNINVAAVLELCLICYHSSIYFL